MKAIIVGGGKVGFYLTNALREHHYQVSLIEKDKERSQYCANNLDAEILHGNGTALEALEACGAKKADCIIAVTGTDESNLVCCQIAKNVFGVRKTIAKVNNPTNTEVLKLLGVDIVVSATDNIIQSLEHEVNANTMKTLMELDDEDVTLTELTLPQNYALEGKSLTDLKLPSNCNIACIGRNGRNIIPRGGTMLLSEDVLLIVMKKSEEKELRKVLKIKE